MSFSSVVVIVACLLIYQSPGWSTADEAEEIKDGEKLEEIVPVDPSNAFNESVVVSSDDDMKQILVDKQADGEIEHLSDVMTPFPVEMQTRDDPESYGGQTVSAGNSDDVAPTNRDGNDSGEDHFGGESHHEGGDDSGSTDSISVSAEDHDMMQQFYDRFNTTTEIDLVFVLDRSGSVPRKGWLAIVQFVKNVLEHFTVDRYNTRVAVVTYSTTATVDINDLEPGTPSDVETKCSLFKRLDKQVARRTPYGYTATHEALQQANKVLLDSRPGAKKAVIIVTDGRSNIGPPPIRAALDLLRLRWQPSPSDGSTESKAAIGLPGSASAVKDKWDERYFGPQVEIYSFGVAEANTAELRSISSKLPGHLFTMTTFNKFEQFAKSLHGDKQETNWIPADFGDCPEECVGSHSHCMCGTKVGTYACVCDPGYQLESGNTCTPCPQGYYKETLSPGACLACPPNTTTDHDASSSLEQCKLLPGHVRCPPLPPVANGRSFYVAGDVTDEVSDTGIPCDNVNDGNSCHYVCDTGYRLSGSPALTCNYSGTWDGDVPQCLVIDCHQIDTEYQSLVGATVTYLNETTTYGSFVSASCRRGTVAVGPTVWHCDRHGLWTWPSNFRCQELFCNELPLAGQLDATSDECRGPQVPVGTVCQLRCSTSGYQLIGPTEYTCAFDDMTIGWKPENWSMCKDVQPPTIVCPKDLDVTVANWGDNSTIVHFDVQKPQMTDNSGLVVYYRVIGVPNSPAGFVFPVGHTALTHEAHDEAGNSVSCVQYVQVRARTVDVHNCPENITATVTSLRRTARVEWQQPTFVGAGDAILPHVCSVQSGTEFVSGNHHVVCYARDFPGVMCQFYVSIVDPPCPIPYEESPPANGVLVCGVMNPHYPRACRIHCREGYELFRQDAAHKYVCQWDGTWTLNGPWPSCTRMRRSTKAVMENQLYVRYQGSCQDVRSTIAETFVETMTRVLESDHGPCPSDLQCNVEEIRVICGAVGGSASSRLASRRRRGLYAGDMTSPLRLRHRRDAGVNNDDGKLMTVVLVTSAQIAAAANQSEADLEPAVSAADQSRVMATLDQVSAAVWRQVNQVDIEQQTMTSTAPVTVSAADESAESEFTTQSTAAPVTNQKSPKKKLHVTGMKQVRRRWEKPNCHKGEVLKYDGTSFFCYACPPGSYQSDGQCQLCPIGFYQNADGSTSCKRCPSGTTPRAGSRDVKECRPPCPRGHYSLTGLEPCLPCPEGTYQSTLGSTSCVTCPTDTPYTLPWAASTSVADCYDYVECVIYRLTSCDVSSGFRCMSFAAVDSDDAKSDVDGDDRDVRCVCTKENGTGCQSVATTTVETVRQTDNSSQLTRRVDPADVRIQLVENSEHLLDPTADRMPVTADDDEDFDVVFRPVRSRTASATFSTVSVTSLYWVLTSPLLELTTCMWLRPKPNVQSQSTVLSFFGPEVTSPSVGAGFRLQADVINADFDPMLSASVNQNRRSSEVLFPVRAGSWNHLCASWTRLTGHWRLYVNGSSTLTDVYGPAIGSHVTRGSAFVLGESFSGEMSRFDLFRRVLTDEEVWNLASSNHLPRSAAASNCRRPNINGNVLPWKRVQNVLINSAFNGLVVRNPSKCLIAYDDNDRGNLLKLWPEEGTDGSCRPDAVYPRCLNGGTCVEVDDEDGSGRRRQFCRCRPGFSGDQCEIQSIADAGDPCRYNHCLNGGTCIVVATTFGAGMTFACRCPLDWTGKHCQVSRGPTSCAMNPCVNNGTCVDVTSSDNDNDDVRSYRCICPDLASSGDSRFPVISPLVGANCEYLSICDTMPCGARGTCVTIDVPDSRKSQSIYEPPLFGEQSHIRDRGYRCVCDDGFEGEDCSRRVGARSGVAMAKQQKMNSAYVQDTHCQTVDCQNGGECRQANGGFVCICPRDYTGQYCTIMRRTETRRYRVTVSLKVNWTYDLYYDSSFQEAFRLQIHQIFGDLTGDNKLYVVVDNVRNKYDSVSVDCLLVFTRYVDTAMFTSHDVREVLVRQLSSGRLGMFKATADGFSCNELLTDNSHIDNVVGASRLTVEVVRDIMICIVAGVVTVCCTLLLALRLWKRYCSGDTISNSTQSNPTQSQSLRAPENNYVIGGDTSYVLCERPEKSNNTSEKKVADQDPAKCWPSKLGSDINLKWANEYVTEPQADVKKNSAAAATVSKSLPNHLQMDDDKEGTSTAGLQQDP